MSSRKVREVLSKSNAYYIPKNRRLELKYMCLQYPEWKRFLSVIGRRGTADEYSDPTGEEATKRVIFEKLCRVIERSSKLSGGDIYEYILKAVTEDISYPTLYSLYNIPCGRDYFYERYHKFWFILSQELQLL